MALFQLMTIVLLPFVTEAIVMLQTGAQKQDRDVSTETRPTSIVKRQANSGAHDLHKVHHEGGTNFEERERNMFNGIMAHSVGQDLMAGPDGAKVPTITPAMLKAASETTGLVTIFGSYHKSGCELIMKALVKLRGLSNDDELNLIEKNVNEGKTHIFTTKLWDNYYFQPNMTLVTALPNFRMVHLIRDPSAVVVSAYRFHTGCPAFEDFATVPIWSRSWLVEVVDALLVDNTALGHKMDTAMRAQVSLCEFYRQKDVSEEEGAIVEAYRSKVELEHMSKNYEFSSKDERFLQVPLSLTLSDFGASMRCMFDFVKEGGDTFDVEWALNTVSSLDISKAPADDTHVTHGKYDNTEIFSSLHQIPTVADAWTRMSNPPARSCVR